MLAPLCALHPPDMLAFVSATKGARGGKHYFFMIEVNYQIFVIDLSSKNCASLCKSLPTAAVGSGKKMTGGTKHFQLASLATLLATSPKSEQISETAPAMHVDTFHCIIVLFLGIAC